MAVKQDIANHTPADYCIMGTNIQFQNHEPNKVKEELNQYFAHHYEIQDGIEYVNEAFKIDDFYSTTAKLYDLNKQKRKIEKYCVQVDITIE